MPVALALALIVIVAIVSPGSFRETKGCFGDIGFAIVLICGWFPIAFLAGPLGVISIVSGVRVLKKPAAKGRTLVLVAIGLGILEVAASIYVLGLFLREAMN